MTLAEKKRRLRELGMPDMTPQEEEAFQQDIIDTAGRDLREAGRGTVLTTIKGSKVKDGAYKGLTRPEMEQAIITGAAPPGKYTPGRMGSVRGSLTGDRLYGPRAPQIAQPAAAAPAPTAVPKLQTMPTGSSGTNQPQRTPSGDITDRIYNDISKSLTASAAPAPTQTATATPQSPAAMPAKTVTQALTTVPSLARPPLAAAKNATAAPRPQGLIDGKPSGQWLQEAANRQGIANSYGTIQPQAAPQIAPAAATRPVDPALMEPRGFGSGAAPTPRPIAPALTEPRGFSAGPVAKPTADVTPPAPAASAAPVDNMSPAGRMKIIQNALSSMPSAAPAMPLTQVKDASVPGGFEQAQRNLDKAAATPGPVAMAAGIGKMVSPVGSALSAAPESIGNVLAGGAAQLGKAGSALGKFMFGDPAAKDRLARGVPRPMPTAAMPKPSARPAKSLQPPQIVMTH